MDTVVSAAASYQRTRCAELGLDGEFELHEVLGSGSAGTVFRATQISLEREVALKVFRLRDDTGLGSQDRFLREARLASAIKHPHVVPVLHYGETPRCRFIAYQRVRGESLRDLLDRTGPMPVDRAVSFFAGVLDGLGHLHARGIVHRDIKPENLLIEDGSPLITDLGIAREDGAATLTAADVILGTLPYMAPEQLRGQPASPASDLFAAAVMIFEAFCGELPFPGENPQQILESQIEGPALLRLQDAGRLHPGWQRFFAVALAIRIEDRFANGRALQEALEALASIPLRRGSGRMVATGAHHGGPTRHVSVRTGSRTSTDGTRSPAGSRELLRTVSRRIRPELPLGALLAGGLGVALLVAVRPRAPAGAVQPPPAGVEGASPRLDAELEASRARLLAGFRSELRMLAPPVQLVVSGGKEDDVRSKVFHRLRSTEGLPPPGDDEVGGVFLVRDVTVLDGVRFSWTPPANAGASPPRVSVNGHPVRPFERRGGSLACTVQIGRDQLRTGLNTLILAGVDRSSGSVEMGLDPPQPVPSVSLPRLEPLPASSRSTIEAYYRSLSAGKFQDCEEALRGLKQLHPQLRVVDTMLGVLNTCHAQGKIELEILGAATAMMRKDEGVRAVTSPEDLLARALRILQENLRTHPGDGRTWAALGRALTVAGFEDVGRHGCRHGVVLDPHDLVTWCLNYVAFEIQLVQNRYTSRDCGLMRDVLRVARGLQDEFTAEYIRQIIEHGLRRVEDLVADPDDPT